MGWRAAESRSGFAAAGLSTSLILTRMSEAEPDANIKSVARLANFSFLGARRFRGAF
jgi:hypothetical protein